MIRILNSAVTEIGSDWSLRNYSLEPWPVIVLWQDGVLASPSLNCKADCSHHAAKKVIVNMAGMRQRRFQTLYEYVGSMFVALKWKLEFISYWIMFFDIKNDQVRRLLCQPKVKVEAENAD